jgi:hypothetical protein
MMRRVAVSVRCGVEPAAYAQPRPVRAEDVDGELFADLNVYGAARCRGHAPTLRTMLGAALPPQATCCRTSQGESHGVAARLQPDIVPSRCGAMVAAGPHGQPRSCRLPATRCGLLLHRPKNRPAETWLSFACEAHATRLVAPRELLDRDQARA